MGEAGGVRPVLEEAEVEETEERRVDAEEIGGGESVSDGVGADADSGDGAMGGSGSAAGTMRRVGCGESERGRSMLRPGRGRRLAWPAGDTGVGVVRPAPPSNVVRRRNDELGDGSTGDASAAPS